MASGINFKLYDPVAQLVATGGGSGGGLPLTGGTLTGNLVLTAPAKVLQCENPTGACDVVNLQYAVGAFQAKKPTAVANNVAFFGSGADTGQTIDSGYSVDTNLSNPPSNTTLWPSSRLIGALQYGADVYKATGSINLAGGGGTAKAFSAGNTTVGPAVWPNLGSTFSLNPAGIATISNALQYTTYYRIIFVACSLSESTNTFGSIDCQFQNELGPVPIGVLKTLRCLPTTAPFASPAFCNEVYLTAVTGVAAAGTINFSVVLTNNGVNSVVVDPSPVTNPCLLIVERVA